MGNFQHMASLVNLSPSVLTHSRGWKPAVSSWDVRSSSGTSTMVCMTPMS